MGDHKEIEPSALVQEYLYLTLNQSKPAGLTVHRSRDTPRSQLVLNTMLKRQLARKVYPVHRLDHRTSGAILLAFNSKTCGLLQKALTFNGDTGVDTNDNIERSKKQYIALLKGDWKRKFGDKEEVTIDKPLLVKGILKDAKTVFRVLASSPGIIDQTVDIGSDDSDDDYFSQAACSLVLCSPETGRTHQIRRHAVAMGLSIIGDSRHGDSKINRWWRENRDLDRLFLHCLSLDLPSLELMDILKQKESQSDEKETVDDDNDDGCGSDIGYDSNDRIKCTAPLPEDLSKVLMHDDMSSVWDVAKSKDARLKMIPFDDRGGTFGRNYKQ